METDKKTKGRGFLTDDKLKREMQFFAPEFDTTKVVRFMPYLDYCLKNQGYINLVKMSDDEMDVLDYFCRKKLIVVDEECTRITAIDKQFYDFIQNVLFDAYVCIK